MLLLLLVELVFLSRQTVELHIAYLLLLLQGIGDICSLLLLLLLCGVAALSLSPLPLLLRSWTQQLQLLLLLPRLLLPLFSLLLHTQKAVLLLSQSHVKQQRQQ